MRLGFIVNRTVLEIPVDILIKTNSIGKNMKNIVDCLAEIVLKGVFSKNESGCKVFFEKY